MWVSFWLFYFASLVYVCLCQYHIVIVSMTLQCILKSGSVLSSVLFFLKITLAILKFLLFHINFRAFFFLISVFKKSAFETLLGLVLNW